jgi:1,4-dihydroxy-2-naphthoate octaprenyltransferase
VLGAFGLIALFAIVGWTPQLTALAALAAPAAAGPVRTVYRETGSTLNRVLRVTARLHLATGAAMALAAAISG